MVTIDRTKGVAPNTGTKSVFVQLSDVDSYETIYTTNLNESLSSIDMVLAYDQTNGAQLTAGASGTVITLDSGNANTGLDVGVLIIGEA